MSTTIPQKHDFHFLDFSNLDPQKLQFVTDFLVKKYRYPKPDTGAFSGVRCLSALDLRGEAQILQLADGCLDAVVTAVDGDSLGVQRNGELQLRGGEGVGDALHTVFAHHVGYFNRCHFKFLLKSYECNKNIIDVFCVVVNFGNLKALYLLA